MSDEEIRTDEKTAETAGDAGTPAPAPPRRGFYLTARQAFGILAGVLAVVLVGLVVWLLFFMGSGSSLVTRGGDVKAGIKPLFTIDGPGTGALPRFNRPMGAAFGIDGRIYVSDTGNNRICVFSSTGRFLFEFGSFGVAKPLPGAKNTWTLGKLNYPIGIRVDSQDGVVYVADFHNDQVQAFSSEGKPLRAFPDAHKPVGKGSSGADGQGIAVTALAVKAGKVYATDQYQTFEFDTDGTFVKQWGKPGTAPGDLDHPNGIAAADDGTVYVSDSNHARLTAFDKDAKVKWTFGTLPAGEASASASPPLQLPRGATVMSDGRVLVADAFAFELVSISKNGKLIGRYGERGTAPGEFNFPNDVDSSGDRIVVADKENGRIQVLQLVGP
jgi:DNA-binding beta-propeller fold protein YncE